MVVIEVSRKGSHQRRSVRLRHPYAPKDWELGQESHIYQVTYYST